jgi:hypothetical protein
MDILRDESPVTFPCAPSTSSFDRALLLLTVVAPFILFVYHPGHEWVCAVPLFLIVLRFWRHDFNLFVKAAFWPVLCLALLYVPWPFCFILPLAVYFSAYPPASELLSVCQEGKRRYVAVHAVSVMRAGPSVSPIRR